MRTIQLGDRVKDKITGFTGIAIASYQYLNGCVRVAVQPEKLHEGKPIEAQTFDEPQLDLVKSGAVPCGDAERGGPRPEPARRPEPPR